jgi:hypothetical protein
MNDKLKSYAKWLVTPQEQIKRNLKSVIYSAIIWGGLLGLVLGLLKHI